MKLTSFVFGILFLVCGILLLCNQINVFLGKHKKSKEEINTPKFKSFTRNAGAMIAICGVIFIINGFSNYYLENVFVWLFLAWIVIAIGDVCFVLNTKPRKLFTKGGHANEERKTHVKSSQNK